MEQIQNNMQKYENYKEQMGRLKKALGAGFNLEAIFIEYAIMEDRLESVLRHAGKWKEPKSADQVPSIQRKKTLIVKMAEEKKSLAHKYFSDDTLERVIMWKNKRNSLIHELLKQSLQTEELEELAQQGQELVKELSNKVKLFNRATDRQMKNFSEASDQTAD